MNIIETYRGIEITQSCGYYYPSISGDIECVSVEGVKAWIDLYLSIPTWIRDGFAILELV